LPQKSAKQAPKAPKDTKESSPLAEPKNANFDPSTSFSRAHSISRKGAGKQKILIQKEPEESQKAEYQK